MIADKKIMQDNQVIASIEEIIEDARQGRMVILVDDESRENEGDFYIPAAHVTPENINFMITHGRGLVCLSLTPEQISRLELPMMVTRNSSRFQTAFTVSIEAKEGVSTGISAFDRAHTIKTAISESAGPSDIATPGHIFPLKANAQGVLAREGHTEAAVDIARLAGLFPAGVICEILNPDGTMARLPELMSFAQRFDIKIGKICDLIAYRKEKGV